MEKIVNMIKKIFSIIGVFLISMSTKVRAITPLYGIPDA